MTEDEFERERAEYYAHVNAARIGTSQVLAIAERIMERNAELLRRLTR